MAGGTLEEIGSLRPPETKEQLDALLANAPSRAPPEAAKFAEVFERHQKCIQKCIDRIIAQSTSEGMTEEQAGARKRFMADQCEPLCGRKIAAENKKS